MNIQQESPSRIALGGAQFGLDYGITNLEGKVSSTALRALLEYSCERNIRTIDTALAYGDSEEALGQAEAAGLGFRFVSKTSPDLFKRDRAQIFETLINDTIGSIRRLKAPKLHGLLVHRIDDLFSESAPAIVGALENLKASGLVEKIGVSLYDPSQISPVLKRFTPDIVQLPFNIWDQRFLRDGSIAKLKSLGIEIHARSVFLQGVLLTEPKDLPQRFKPWLEDITRYHNVRKAAKLSALSAAISFVQARPEIDLMILGVVNQVQLGEILQQAAQHWPLDTDLASLAIAQPELIDPRKWAGS